MIDTWSVPSHTLTLIKPKSTQYCIVIPVINEGELIDQQLIEMNNLGLDKLVDIIITDGGTTDGSISKSLLEKTGVRAILKKTGMGKLSAQLRIGYSFAMNEGYDGVITIDGNGKDSCTSIPLFLKALINGVDYAQASRFIAEGKGINTPLLRSIAVRMIHAPILSIAAGRKFTDTTQGFRAYSRNYLMDPRVQPFRDIFQSYELLAYLTARASQIGMNVIEIPTIRKYPAKGAIPTKINVVEYFNLIYILLKTMMKCYHPKKERA